MLLKLTSCSIRVPVYVALLLFSYLSSYGDAARLSNETDRRALLEFKAKITSDRLGVLKSWNDTTHFCQWHGVSCGRRHQRVVALKLDSTQLVGSISPHLGNLSFLRLLSLENNSFGNEIPQEIWDLGKLEQLRLTNNSLVGVIRSNISSSELKIIHLSGNLLLGEIPDTLGCLSKLQDLHLSRNKLTGKFPPSLGNLSSLETLVLAVNSMIGIIPESVGQLKNLAFIAVGDNRFSGSIPASFFNLSNLRFFALEINQFQGSLPAGLGANMPYIEVISVGRNQFSGTIPPSISNATRLTTFVATDNNFKGSLPSLYKLNSLRRFSVPVNHLGSGGESDLSFLCSLANATQLQFMSLASNNFGGVIPECIGNLSRDLGVFNLQINKLSGKIPSAIVNLINLEKLYLFRNQLFGHIPTNIGGLEKLQLLDFDTNHLSGNIPSSFGNLKRLIILGMGQNNLQGSIPPSLRKCYSLILLDISVNKLSGSIPHQLFNLSPFSMGINLSGNHLTGNIPSQVGSLKNIGFLDLSRNLLSGKISGALGSCASLEILDISGNLLQGTVPSSLSLLRGLQILNLSSNQLTGEIPRSFASFKVLNILDLSYNDFQGIVPSQGIFLNASVIFLTGNNKLCGGILELHLPKCSFHQSNNTWKKILLIISLILAVSFGVFVMLSCWLRRRGNKSLSSDSPYQFTELSYYALFKATNGFSLANLIGAGSFGSVYKGVLDEGGKLVAIKVLNLHQRGASKSFMTECEALRNVRHRNLVKILTVCSSLDHQGNDFKALVTEFMSNGSLDEWLHQKVELVDSNQKPRILDLLQRLGIVIDVACALDYLHNQCATPIVHCDIKPSNVLLDDDMTAHLCDLGLAKFIPGIPREDSFQNETSSICIRGSVGYTAPEYGMASEVSTNGDVYSYGVLLLEMFTGKRPTNEIFQDGLNLHQFAKGALPENMWEIIDPTLLCQNQELEGISIGDVEKGTRKFQRIQEALVSIMGIGVTCSTELPKERMNMCDVVAQLSLVKDKLLEVGVHKKLQNMGTGHYSIVD